MSEGFPPGYSDVAPIPASVARRMAWNDYEERQPPKPPEELQ